MFLSITSHLGEWGVGWRGPLNLSEVPKNNLTDDVYVTNAIKTILYEENWEFGGDFFFDKAFISSHRRH